MRTKTKVLVCLAAVCVVLSLFFWPEKEPDAYSSATIEAAEEVSRAETEMLAPDERLYGEDGNDDEEHAQERTDSSGQAGAEAVIVDALASLFRRNTGGNDGVGRRRYDAVSHAVEEADYVENS